MRSMLIAPASMLAITQQDLHAQTYALPFKTDDLKPYKRVFTGNHKAGIQGTGRQTDQH